MIWLAVAAWGHPLAPAALDVDVVDARTLEVQWRTPTARPTGVRLVPRVEADCAVVPQPPTIDGAWLVSQRRYDCPEGYADARVGVDGLGGAPVDVVLTVRDAAGTSRRLLTAEHPMVPLAEPATAWTAFFGLGVQHLLEGLDHILLVIGLTVLLGPTRRLITALTTFTLGHTSTLFLVALGGGGPAAIVELGIALSIVWLALELAAEDERTEERPGFLARYPGVLSAAIGLLHGAGFGGALLELGLPREDVVGALLLFNLGVDAGQLGVVAVLLLLGALVPPLARMGRLLPAYAIGSVAMAWTIERALAVLGLS